jgi:hypothetical protein
MNREPGPTGLLVGGQFGQEWDKISPGDLPHTPSSLLLNHFSTGEIDFLGKVNRVSKFRDEELENSSLKYFCLEKDLKLEQTYRMVVPNMSASFQSVSKYDKVQPTLNEESWALSGEWTKQHFIQYMGGSKVLDEATCIRESDRSTSGGYPMNREYTSKGDFFDQGPTNMLGDFWNMMGREEERPMRPIWTCSQKRELRSVEKLLLNKIRTFTASPIEHGIALNRFCMDMNNKFYSSHNKTWSFVGCSKFMQGWNALFTRLAVHPNAFELDESEYDSSLFARAMYGQFEIRWDMLREEDKTPENFRRFKRLYDDIVHSVIVLENGELIQKHTGNPSGSANTIVDNTMILFRLFAYAWIELVRVKFGASNAEAEKAAMTSDLAARCYTGSVFGSYSDFMSNVEAALNGDDNTFTVSQLCVSWFNPKTIAPIWSGIGITTKTPCEEPRELKDVQFLSQGFRNQDGLWLPVPDTDRVLSSLQWGSAIDDIRWHLLRAYALRIDSWGNLECRSFIQLYIEWVWNHPEYKEQLCGEVTIDGQVPMKWVDIQQSYKSNDWCWALYAGEESKGSEAVIAMGSLLKFFRTIFESSTSNSLPSSSSFYLNFEHGTERSKAAEKAGQKDVQETQRV